METKHKSWRSIEELFSMLNNSGCCYLILRNYEEMNGQNFYCNGHGDIDFLTNDRKRLIDSICGFPRFNADDRIHYQVFVEGIKVEIDVRTVGDDYYDRRWQEDMLNKRQLMNNHYYIMDLENYYYSLVYHAILQKKVLGEDYRIRLHQMAWNLGFYAKTQQEHIAMLDQFMKEKGYYYNYPTDYCVPLNAELVDSRRVKKYSRVIIRNAKWELMRQGSNVKRRILGVFGRK
jgi:hypothetical protein